MIVHHSSLRLMKLNQEKKKKKKDKNNEHKRTSDESIHIHT